MSLETGTRLGAYEILAPIGAGGMGEVYRAHDTKLKRDVAVKVLLPSVAADAERLERLKREAQVLASLNHPHIAAIYGLEEENGQPYLVLELVEGPTLAERMQQGPIPLEEALPIAKQMAEALAEAHEKSIVHRDLKPANVKLTPEGRVKVLDFGLAKALAGDGEAGDGSADLSQSPTLSRQATAAGVILGTAAYMSPEQAKGKSVDRRTDVWAFGVVLYEMLTGKRLFQGDDVSETLAAVLRAEPDFDALPPETPSSIRRLARRCLERERDRRLDSMRAGWLELDEAQQSPSELASEPPRVRRWTLALAAAALVGLGALLATSLRPSGPPAPRPVTRFSFALESTVFQGFGRAIAIAPDGSHVAYVGEQMLRVRSMDRDQVTPIAGTRGARTPFFSPDGQWVGFAVGNQLKKVSIEGGAPITICETDASPLSARWSADDTIVFSWINAGILRVSANGGTPEVVVPWDRIGTGISGPQLLPGGKAFLLTVGTAAGTQSRVAAYVVETGETRVLVEEGVDARYLPTGHLLYGLEGSLLAVPFDVDRLEVTGGAIPLVESVAMRSGIVQYDVSETGSLVYLPGGVSNVEGTLVWVDRGGVARPITESRRFYERPRLSPNGHRLAIQINAESSTDAWVMDLDRSVLTKLTFGGGVRPIWAPDGNTVFYAAVTSPGIFDIFSTPADGSGSTAQITEGAYRIPDAFTPDGKTLIFRQQGGDGGRDIGMLSLDGDGEPTILLGSPYDELHGTVSPDGKWIAYTSDESGEREVYVQSFPDLGNKRKVSAAGGAEPEWSTDGTELFYRDGDAMMAVTVSAGANLELSRPLKLFEGAYVTSADEVSQSYDVASDGRFVMVRREDRSESVQRIHVVLNWVEELKARVPTE